mmetsp:Transcript_27398/g.57431  ORF Transcript_27398/g.57431 Transcript_27398/m.57431 type:complete len:89 (+) Transcript_27398:231-497(+)
MVSPMLEESCLTRATLPNDVDVDVDVDVDDDDDVVDVDVVDDAAELEDKSIRWEGRIDLETPPLWSSSSSSLPRRIRTTSLWILCVDS